MISAVLGPVMIPMLKRLKVGQTVREDGPDTHLKKSGTPTMGGVLILISITLTTFWLYLMYGTPFQVLFTTRLVKAGLNFFVNIFIIYVFLEAFQRIMRVAIPAQR